MDNQIKEHYIFTDHTNRIRVTSDKIKAVGLNVAQFFVGISLASMKLTAKKKPDGLWHTKIEHIYKLYNDNGTFLCLINKEDIPPANLEVTEID